MELTRRQIAHVLAALRHTQNLDLSSMDHFDDTEPLTCDEVNQLCEIISCGPPEARGDGDEANDQRNGKD